MERFWRDRNNHSGGMMNPFDEVLRLLKEMLEEMKALRKIMEKKDGSQ